LISLSVFFPAYNDAPSIGKLVNKIFEVLRQRAPDVGLVNGFKLERHDPWHRIAIET